MKLNNKQVSVITLVGGFIMFFFGFGFFLIGNKLYGSDAGLIFAGGLLTYVSIQTIVNSISIIINKKNAKEVKKGEKKS